MGKDFQKSALPTFLHFVRVRAAHQLHVGSKITYFFALLDIFEFGSTSLSGLLGLLSVPSKSDTDCICILADLLGVALVSLLREKISIF